MSLRNVVSSQEMDTKLTGDTASVQLTPGAWLTFSAVQFKAQDHCRQMTTNWIGNIMPI